MEKVLLYARRSNKKNQDRAISIEKQLEAMRNYCKEKWYEIVEEFHEIQSSFKEWKRIQYDKLLNEIKNRNVNWKWEKIDKLIVYIASRLCRNSQEAFELQLLVENEIVIIESVTENFWHTLAGKRMLINALTAAIYESKEKSTEWKKNMDLTYSRWEVAWVAPFWYRKISKKELITIPEEEEIVIKIFNLYKTWTYTFEKVANELNDLGYIKHKKVRPRNEDGIRTILKPIPMKFNAKDIENILIKRFYYGHIDVTYKNLTKEEIDYFKTRYPDINSSSKKTITIDYTHIIQLHKPYKFLIDEETFQECYNIRSGKDKKKLQFNRTEVLDEDKIHPWRWILKCWCQMCEGKNPLHLLSFTSEKKKGKYIYYRCSWLSRKTDWENTQKLCITKAISQKEVEELLKPVLEQLIFTDEEIKIFKDIFLLSLQDEKKTKEQIILELKNDIASQQRIKDAFMKQYREETFAPVKEDIKKDIETTMKHIELLQSTLEKEENSDDSNNEVADIKLYLERVKDLKSVLSEEIPSKKQKRLQSIFDYVVIYNGSLLSYKLNPVLEYLLRCNTKSSTIDNWDSHNEIIKVEPKESWTESQESFPLLVTTPEGSSAQNRTEVNGFGDRYTDRCATELYMRTFVRKKALVWVYTIPR
jgi:DNA invertase Pin-like site-specific DNA recombinase